jgi:hypothetical protein
LKTRANADSESHRSLASYALTHIGIRIVENVVVGLSLHRTPLKVLAWLVFGVYMVLLAKIIVFKNVPVSIATEQFATLDFAQIKRHLAQCNFVPLKGIAEYLFEGENIRKPPKTSVETSLCLK